VIARRLLSRRGFIGGAAATACVGCAGGDGPTGGEVTAGTLTEVRDAIAAEGSMYVPAAQAWLVAFPSGPLDAALALYDPALHAGLRDGLMALSQKCPHMGCRVPYCSSSGWFECFCHLGLFGPTGEYRDGVAERGMDQFPVSVRGNAVVIDASVVVRGLPKGSTVDDRGPVGGHCVGGSSGA
jgi:cytochrome b6-f complex iron-sulfur subunit